MMSKTLSPHTGLVVSVMTERASPDLETLRELVRDGDAILTVRNAPFGKTVGITTTDSPDYCLEPEVREMFLDMLDTYEELIITLHDIHEHHDGIEKLWHIGKAINEHSAARGLDEPVYEEISVFVPFINASEEILRYSSCLHDLYDSPRQLPEDEEDPSLAQPESETDSRGEPAIIGEHPRVN